MCIRFQYYWRWYLESVHPLVGGYFQIHKRPHNEFAFRSTVPLDSDTGVGDLHHLAVDYVVVLLEAIVVRLKWVISGVYLNSFAVMKKNEILNK